MSDLIFFAYSLALRMFGLLSLAMFGGAAYSLSVALAEGRPVVLFGLLAVIFFILGLRLTIPRLTPQWLRAPSGFIVGILLMSASVPILFTYYFTLLGMVELLQNTKVLGVNVAVWEVVLTKSISYVIAYWGALSFLNGFYGNRYVVRPAKPNHQSASPEDLNKVAQDLRSLRHSRMKRSR